MNKNLIRAAVQQGALLNQNIFIPDGFPSLPCKFTYSNDDIVTDMDFEQYKGGVKIYVKTTGNDTSGNGSELTPYRTITKAITVILASAEIKFEVITDVEIFNRDQCVFNQTLTGKTIAFISTAINKSVISTNNTYTWTADENVYSTSRTGTVGIADNLNRDENGLPIVLLKVADLVTCKSTANSWYTDDTLVYINRIDGLLPTNSSTIILINVASIDPVLNNSTVYFENFIFVQPANGNALRIRGTAATFNDTFVCNNCYYVSANQIVNGNGLATIDIKNTYVFNCISAYAQRDGFNYHYDNCTREQAEQALVIEYNCKGYNFGLINTSTSDNVSSCHDGANILRVKVSGGNNNGSSIVDVTGCISVLHKCMIDNLINTAYQFTSENTDLIKA